MEPGIRQNLSSKVWFINKSIAGHVVCESLKTTLKTVAISEAINRLAHYRQQFQQAQQDTDPAKVTFAMATEKYNATVQDQVVNRHLSKRTQEHAAYVLQTLQRTWGKTAQFQFKGKVPFMELNPKKADLEDCQEWRRHTAVEEYSPYLHNLMLLTPLRASNFGIFFRYQPPK